MQTPLLIFWAESSWNAVWCRWSGSVFERQKGGWTHPWSPDSGKVCVKEHSDRGTWYVLRQEGAWCSDLPECPLPRVTLNAGWLTLDDSLPVLRFMSISFNLILSREGSSGEDVLSWSLHWEVLLGREERLRVPKHLVSLSPRPQADADSAACQHCPGAWPCLVFPRRPVPDFQCIFLSPSWC